MSMDTTVTAMIELDARHRAPLGKLAQHDRYLTTVERSGRIIMEPVVVLTHAQVKLLQDGEYWAGVETIALKEGSDAVDFDELPVPD